MTDFDGARGRGGTRRLLALAWIGLCGVVPQARAENAGFVLEISGEWQVQGAAGVLRQGDTAPFGARLVPRNPDANSRLVFLLNGGGSLYKSCAIAVDCRSPLRLPDRAESNRQPDTFWAAVRRLVAARPDRYAITAGRGFGLSDSVLVLDARYLDLSALCRTWTPGIRRLILARLDEAGPPLRYSLDWDGRGPAYAPAADFRPGLYTVSLDGSNEPPAWILVTPSDRYEAAAAAFAQARSIADLWDAAVPRSSRILYLRAVLDHLAQTDRP